MVIRFLPKSLGFAALSVLVLAGAPAHAATFTVNVLTDVADATAGDGNCGPVPANAQCSLRAAIQEANAFAGDDTIQFSVTGTISAATALTAITQTLFINGPLPVGSVIVDGGDAQALFNYAGTITGDYSISNLTIRNGRATDGGGVNFHPTVFSTLQLTDVSVTSNQALGGAGGGIAVSGAATNEVTITGGSITGNTATGNGGGVSASGGVTVNLTDVTVSGNSAANGGGIGLSGSTLDLATSTLSGNTASADGGGLFLGVALPATSSSARLNLCTIAGNTATNGGGIGATSTNNSPSSMVHCTVAGNFATATNGGGGIGVLAAAANANAFFPGDSTNPFTNNIVADNFIGNTSGARSDCRQAFAHTDPDDSDYNVTSTPGGTNSACGFTQTNSTATANGCTGSLADRLGLTQTRNLNAGCAGAIDRANPKWDSATDQRGAPVANGNKLGGSERDIGAYEFAAYGAVEFAATAITVREDAGTVQAQVLRYGNLTAAGSANFATSLCGGGCTPAEAGDFTATSGTRSWGSGEFAAQNIDVPIVDDTEINEGNEQFDVGLSNLTQGSDVGTNGSARVTITDIENGALQFTSTAATACEEDDPLTCPPDDPLDPNDTPRVVSFVVERAGENAVNEAISVAVAYSGTANRGTGASCNFGAGDDYLVTVPAGDTATQLNWAASSNVDKTITITVCDDSGASAEFEPDQTAILTLGPPSANARLGTPVTATATIISDDAADPGELSIKDVEYIVAEDVAGGLATVTVTRTNGNDQAVSVDYRTSAGTAQAGSDYSSRSGTLTWAAEDSADKTFTVPIVNDALREPQEQFTVILSNPNNTDDGTNDPVLGAITTAPVKINSEDKMKFRFTQSSWTAIEGSPVTILVEPTQAVVDGPYAIDYATTDGSAAASSDYTAAAAALNFSNGETAAKSFTITTASDGSVEGNETFTVALSTANVAGQIQAPNPTTVTISEDDTGFQLDAATYSVGEAGGSVVATVKRVGSSTGAVSVNYATSNGTATDPSDYTGTSGTLNWANGDSADKTVNLTIAEDSADEDAETFTFALNTPSAGTQLLSPNSAQATIIDNDAVPTLTINTPPSVTEGNGGTVPLTFTVTLSAASGKTVTVDYVSANGTATAGSDYTAVGGTLSFAPGETTKPVPVTVLADTLDEANETLTVTLSNAGNAGITTAVGTGTIMDDDATPTVSIGDASVTEGSTTDVTLSFPVTLSAASGRTITINYSTANGSAVAPGDYTAVSSATITFTAGQTSQVATVTVKSDSADEQAETLTVILSNSVNATINDGTAVGAINDAADDVSRDDVPAVVVTVSGGTVTATSGGGGGSFSTGGLFGLLALLALRRRQVRYALAACFALAPVLASAENLSYKYADVRYISVDADPDVSASGFSLAGSMPLKDFFLTGSYAQADTDDFMVQAASGSVKSTSYSLGLGRHRAVNKAKTMDLTVAGNLVHAKAEGSGGFAGSVDDTGYSLDVGLRTWFKPKLEWGATLNYLALFDDGSTSLNAQWLYHYNPRFALALGAGFSDDASQFNLGVRFGF